MIQDLPALTPAFKKYPVACLMRHAHRFVIPKGSYGNEINLTNQGKKEAQSLANMLEPYLVEIYSSPILRCIETAQYFQAKSKTGNLIPHKYFGAPGIYVEDEQVAGPLFLQMTSKEIALTLAKGKIPPGFSKTLSASKNLLMTMLSRMNQGAGLYPFVSHDYIISVFLSSFFPREDYEILWPMYLEGVFVWSDKTCINLRFRSEFHTICLL